jgi:polyphosphate kinase 2 (PPK2 family)
VHPHLVHAQRIPHGKVGSSFWRHRLEDIVAFERHLARNGTAIVKFFLNVSRGEQRKRFLDRLDAPEKNWKFSVGDVRERGHWDAYMEAYEEAIGATSTDEAPWYVVPADNKWISRAVVAAVLAGTIRGLGLEYPRVDEAGQAELAAARRQLEAEDD